ncbi:MAG: LPP20 family lipoprotein [Deltaproteobacteria bacterium]|nr:LPP20 family lipoprotein [Deltaproteobacteria bacterium]
MKVTPYKSIVFFAALLMLIASCAQQPNVLTKAEEIQGIYEGQDNPNAFILIRVTGKGIAPEGTTNPAQAKILSERAAMADAYRLLSEKLRGVLLTSFQTTRNAQITADVVRTQTEAILRATQVLDTRHYPDGLTEIDMAIRISKSETDF